MSVTEEMHDRRGHEIKGQAVEQRMRGIHVREAGREESPSNERRVGARKSGKAEFTYMRPEVTLRMSTRKLSSMNLKRVLSPVVRCVATGQPSKGSCV